MTHTASLVVACLACVAGPAILAPLPAQAQVPAGFADELVLRTGASPAGLKFSPQGDLLLRTAHRG